MRKELGLSPCVIMFENHTELMRTLEDYTDYHREMVERYRERLGNLLRRGSSKEGSGFQTTKQGFDQSGIADTYSDQSQQNKKKDSKKRESEEKGWIMLEEDECVIKVAALGGSSSSSSEVSVLFKVVEALTAKVVNLKNSTKLIAELPSRGIRQDQRFLVIFKDGIPKQIIPTNESYAQQTKFTYAEEFELSALERF